MSRNFRESFNRREWLVQDSFWTLYSQKYKVHISGDIHNFENFKWYYLDLTSLTIGSMIEIGGIMRQWKNAQIPVSLHWGWNPWFLVAEWIEWLSLFHNPPLLYSTESVNCPHSYSWIYDILKDGSHFLMYNFSGIRFSIQAKHLYLPIFRSWLEIQDILEDVKMRLQKWMMRCGS